MTFPWGPLLEAALGEPGGLAAIAALMRPAATLRVLVSVTDRERRTLPAERALVSAYAAAGLTLHTVRPATGDEVAASRSSWGKRLGAGRTRPATLIEAARGGDGGRHLR